MAIKSSIILAMFLALVTYARSQDLSEAKGFPLAGCKNVLSRAGYVEVGQCHQSKGRLIETFELRTPSSPHSHLVWQIELISRGDQVLDVFNHGTDGAEIQD